MSGEYQLQKLSCPCSRRQGRTSSCFRAFLLAFLTLSIFLSAGCKGDLADRAQKHLRNGQAFAKQGKSAEAIIEYRRAIQNNPQLVAAHLELAKLFLDRKEYLSAAREFRAVLKWDAANQEARIQLADLKFKARYFAEAKKDAEEFLRTYPEDPRALMILAESAHGLKDARLARSTVEGLLKVEATNSRGWYLLAILQLQAGELAQGERSLRQAIQHKTDWMVPVVALASLLVQQKAVAQGEEVLRQALATNPSSLDAHYLMASFFWQQQRLSEAEEVFRKIKSLGENDPEYRGALALFYALSGKWEQAEQEYRDIIGKHGDDVPNRQRLAGLYMGQGRTAEAETLLEGILKQNSSDARTLLIRGQLHLQQGRIEESLQDLLRAVQADPRWPLGRYHLAGAYLRQGYLKLAEDQLRNALEIAPNFTEARVLLAQLELDSGKAEKALAEFDRAVARRPASVVPYVMRSMALARQGNYSEAEKDLLPLLEEFPLPSAQVLTYRALAWVKFHQRRPIEARRFAHRALALEPLSRDALFLLGLTYFAEKRAASGLVEVEAHVRAHPHWNAGPDVLGHLMGLAGRYDDAVKQLEKAIEMNPKATSTWMALSEIAVRQGKMDLAKDTLSKLAAQQPRFALAHVRLGQLAEFRKDWGSAVAHYQKALGIDPRDAVAKNNLAWVYAEQGGNIDVALRLAQEAKEARPDDPMISDTLGWIYVKKQSFGNAIQLFRQSVEKNPQKALYHYHLGVAYYRAGKKVEAKQSLQMALKLQRDIAGSQEAKEILGALSN